MQRPARKTITENGVNTPLQIVALRAESYAPLAVVISLRAKYSTADRKYLVPLECLHDLVLDLQRFSATAGMSAAPNLVEPHPKGCAGLESVQNETSQETASMTFRISSPAFADGQRIPTKYTVDGDDISPPLDWSDAPAGAKSFLLVVEDPDAPSGTFHHWGLYNLHTRGVPEGFASADRQDDIESAINDFGEPGYRGPAPPPGHGTHHYHFKVAALDAATRSFSARSLGRRNPTVSSPRRKWRSGQQKRGGSSGLPGSIGLSGGANSSGLPGTGGGGSPNSGGVLPRAPSPQNSGTSEPDAPAQAAPSKTIPAITYGKPPPPPEFPWPPPAASASYVLPKDFFENRRTIGEVAAAIISALERNGYVERSFFRIEAGGVALVTRLERIRDDGSSFVESQRWPVAGRGYSHNLSGYLRGLFFVDPGHYRIIVFILRDLPFSQSSQIVTRDEADGWLHSGANIMSPEIAKEKFGDGYCTVLVYEFASDGRAVRVVQSRLTGKEHLTKAGLLSLLAKD